MHFPNDILYEIWIKCNLIEKRALALTCKYLVTHSRTQELNMYIRKSVGLMSMANFTVHLYYVNNVEIDTHQVKFLNRLIGAIVAGTQFHSCSINLGEKQIVTVINWLNERGIQFKSDGIFASHKYVCFYLKPIDLPKACEVLRWIYLYGLLKTF